MAETLNSEIATTSPLVDIDAMTSTLNTNRSEVQEHIAATVAAEVKQEQITDKSGELFNPEIHDSTADGKPIKTTSGAWRLKRGRKKNSTAKVSQVKTPGAIPAVDLNSDAGRKLAAHTLTSCTFQLGMFMGGDGAKPIIQYGINEQEQIFYAYDRYLEAKNINDIPPGVALLMGLSMYGLRVASLEPAKAKGKSIFYGIKAKIYTLIGAKKYGSQSVSGNDGKRKNDTSATNSDKPTK